MNFFGFKFKNKNRSFTEASSVSSVNKNTYKKLLVKASSLISSASGGRGNVSPPEFDFDEIRMACKADSYVKTSYMKYSYMLFKAGYKLESENEKATDYIKQRFNAMSFLTRVPMDVLLQECGDDLLKYSNAILIKSRTKKMMPGLNAKGFFKDQPVGGYFRADITTISVKRDNKGDISKYVQTVEGEEKEFDPEDVIHFYLDRESDSAFGTPRMLAALEDVKLLRRIEGNVVAMIYRFAMPLFHWIIGLPQNGFQATNKEIDEAKREIEGMSLDGTIITNEKTQVKVIGAEGSAMNAEGYLKYFEQRVFSALGVSESQMGRGGAKQDADSMESQAHDTIKHIQRIMGIFIQEYMLNELLLEGGFNPIMNEDDKVNFVFNEINIETKIKVENHEMVKYQSNMITFEEMRRTIGKKEAVNVEDLYKFKVEVEADAQMTQHKTDGTLEITMQAGENAKELAKINAANQSTNTSGTKSSSPNGNGKNKTTKPNNDAKNKNTPSNQHGTSSVKIKEASTITNKKLKAHNENYIDVYNKYFELSNDIIEAISRNKEDEIDLLFPLSLESILYNLNSHLNISSNKGIEAAIIDLRKDKKKFITYPNLKIENSMLQKEVKNKVSTLLKDIKKRIDVNNPESINIIFESLSYRLRFLIEYVMPKAYWHSYLKAGEQMGYTKAIVNFNGSDDEEKHSKVIELNQINLNEMPPYHPFCDCTINFKKGDE